MPLYSNLPYFTDDGFTIGENIKSQYAPVIIQFSSWSEVCNSK